MKNQVKFSDVYDCEIEKNLVFKRSKLLISLSYLLTIAFLMSFTTQAFFWGFALVIGLPVYFFLMNIVFKYQASTKYAAKSGAICFYGSIAFIIIITSLFSLIYKSTYATYFSQKYTPKWCRGISLENQLSSKLNYYTITYQIYDTQEEADLNSPQGKFGCGCFFKDKSSMSQEGIDGYEYQWKSDGSLLTLPFWICNSDNGPLPKLANYEGTRRCYEYQKGSKSKESSQNPNTCSKSSEFIQVTLDNPPYYNTKLLLYLIGFFLMSIFGIGCNFPVSYFILRFYSVPRRYKRSDFTSLDKRKIYMCYALKKVLILDKIKEEQENDIKKSQQVVNRQANSIPSDHNLEYKSKVWRREILYDVIEYLHRDPSALII